MKPIRRDAWLGLLALLWLVVVLVFYFAAHKPITAQSAASIARSAAQLAAALGLISLGGGLGTLLLPETGTSPLVQFALRGALGVGLLSITVLLVSSIVGTSTVLSWVGLILPLVLLHRAVQRWWRGLSGLCDLWKAGGRFGKIIALLLSFIFAAVLLLALAPPLKFDALVYHLALPKTYLSVGSVGYVPGNIFWGMPQVGEMLYLWAMSLAGEPAAACVSWGVGAMAVLGLLGYARRQVGVAAAWVSAAALLAGYTLAAELSWAYVDWFTILYGLAFLVLLHRWKDIGRPSQILLAGLFGGFALGSKYSAGALLAAGAVLIAYYSLKMSTPRLALRNLAVFGLAAGAASAPWLLKNILATGNPFYPLLYPSGAMDAFRLEQYQGFPIWGDWREVLLLPWQATIAGHEGAPGYAASIGPLILGLAPICILGWLLKLDPRLHRLVPAAALAGLGLVIWAVAGRLSGYLLQTRLYLTFFPALGLLSGGGYRVLARINYSGVRFGRLAGSLIVLVLGLNALNIGLDVLSKGAAQTVVGIKSIQQYLDDNLGWHAPAMRSLLDLPGEGRVLMLWEPRSLYCAPRCQPDEVLDRWRSDFNEYHQSETILSVWRQEGFTHLLVHHTGEEFIRHEDDRYSPAEWQTLDELLDVLTPAAKYGEAYTLYRLNP